MHNKSKGKQHTYDMGQYDYGAALPASSDDLPYQNCSIHKISAVTVCRLEVEMFFLEVGFDFRDTSCIVAVRFVVRTACRRCQVVADYSLPLCKYLPNPRMHASDPQQPYLVMLTWRPAL